MSLWAELSKVGGIFSLFFWLILTNGKINDVEIDFQQLISTDIECESNKML